MKISRKKRKKCAKAAPLASRFTAHIHLYLLSGGTNASLSGNLIAHCSQLAFISLLNQEPHKLLWVRGTFEGGLALFSGSLDLEISEKMFNLLASNFSLGTIILWGLPYLIF